MGMFPFQETAALSKHCIVVGLRRYLWTQPQIVVVFFKIVETYTGTNDYAGSNLSEPYVIVLGFMRSCSWGYSFKVA